MCHERLGEVFCNFFTKYFTKGPLGITSLKKINEDEVAAIENDFDPIEAPTLPSSYKIQPKNQGGIGLSKTE